ncbi:hypothetical protein [Nocardia colli]|uniref:hypothetical protein n=1 Tax=Nocardia colli TaxID=2545717 RepID=UPI0035DAC4D8
MRIQRGSRMRRAEYRVPGQDKWPTSKLSSFRATLAKSNPVPSDPVDDPPPLRESPASLDPESLDPALAAM